MCPDTTARWGDYLRPKIPALAAIIEQEMNRGIAARDLLAVVSDGSFLQPMARVAPREIVEAIVKDFVIALVQGMPEIGIPLQTHLDNPQDDTVLVLGFFEATTAFALIPLRRINSTDRGQA